MRRVAFAILSTVSSLVLLLSFKTQTAAVQAAPATTVVRTGTSSTTTIPTTTTPSTTTSSADTPGTTTPPTAAAPSSAASSSGTRTVTGTAVSTRYGPVQVQITVTDGVITDVQAVTYPENNGRDRQINANAVPVLNSETVSADSADIDMVSGATYTSDGYISSLQSALDQL